MLDNDFFARLRQRAAGLRLVPMIGLALSLVLAGCILSSGRYKATPVGVSSASGVSLVNSFRRSNGLPPVRVNSRLAKAARQQSVAMAQRGRISHKVAGSLPRRVSATGYGWSRLSENLGKGYPSLNAAFRGWTNSPGHRKNLLGKGMTEAGFGAARSSQDGSIYWTMIMAAPRRSR